MLRCIFLWFSEEACPKDDLFDYFQSIPSSYEREDLFLEKID
jgi:formate hydrogenlyase subunit 6/NADH:ubiquinone oxidoreductase subunit I